MSLVGSLEDLGLGDILQIITLSRKSGALLLRSGSGEGRVIFRDGLVCGARVKDKTPDLRRLLVDAGVLDAEGFEDLRAEAAEGGVALSPALAERITTERFDGLRRECVERAVLEMFAWETGEFSFEVGEDSPEDEFEVVLDAGINAQYLAMEGTRRTDEGGREPVVDADDPTSFADVAEEIASDDGPADAFEAVALTTVERLGEDADGVSDTEAAVEEALEAAIRGAAEPAAEAEPAAAVRKGRPARSGRVKGDPRKRPPVVVVAPDLPVLEWVKRTLDGIFPRVHIFQKADLAVQRLRQYMSRGDASLVLVSPDLTPEKGQGFRDVDDLVARMKKQSPRSPVLWLGDRAEAGGADGAVACAALQDAASAVGPDLETDLALRDGALAAVGEGEAPPVRPAGTTSSGGRLDEVMARLSAPETRGEVLNVVLHFAAEHFARVALLGLRDGQAEGLAGLGLERAGGPDDAGLRELRIPVAGCAWLGQVVERRAAVRGPAQGDGDRELAAGLGESVPREAWLAPVISRDQLVAILYGDNLPGDDPLPATEKLEAALAAAGQVLEEVAAERARDAG